jgi:hypothetical protein
VREEEECDSEETSENVVVMHGFWWLDVVVVIDLKVDSQERSSLIGSRRDNPKERLSL